MSLCLLYRIFVSLLPYLFIYNLHLSPNNLFFCIHVDSFMLYVPKQQSRCVFLQQRESKLLSNTGHAAEITEQVSPHHLPPHFTPLCSAIRIIMNKLKIYSAN